MPFCTAYCHIPMKKQFYQFYLVIVLVALVASLVSGQTLDINFKTDSDVWHVTNGEVRADPLGKTYLHLASTPQDEQMPRMWPLQALALIPGGQLQIQADYRTDIGNSGMHHGAWVYLQFLDAGGKQIQSDIVGMTFPKARAWNHFDDKIRIPDGAASLRTQFRVQNCPGKYLDLADVKLSNVPVAKIADPLHQPQLQVLASYQLQPNDTLKSTDGQVLQNLSPLGQTPSFQLPDKYCDNSDLYYGIEAVFSVRPSQTMFRTIFSLGSVFTDSDANAMEITIHNQARLMFRVRCANNKARMDWHFPFAVRDGVVTVAARLGRNELDASTGSQWKQIRSVEPFVWAKGQRFYLGSTGGDHNLLDGKIERFKLTVFKPFVTAKMQDGPNAGVFSGPGPHRWNLLFPDDSGLDTTLHLSVTNRTGQAYPLPTVNMLTNDSATLVLPQLPYGWYQLQITVTHQDHQRIITRPFVVIPSLDTSLPAQDSPLGICQSFSLKPESFSPTLTDRLFASSEAAGNRWFRFWLEWDDVERQPGHRVWSIMDQVVQLAYKHHLQLYVVLNGGNLPWQTSYEPGTPKLTTYLSQYRPRDLDQWSAFVTELAKRYHGRISYYQIGNESNTKEFYQPFSPQSYLTFLKAGYKAVKQGSPDAKVGLCGFVAIENSLNWPDMKQGDRIFGAREFWDLHPQPYYDIVDCHFYSLGIPNFYWDEHARDIPKFVAFLKARGETAKPLWNSETGFPSGIKGERGGYDSAPMISDDEQACRIVEWHVQSLSVGIERSFNYLVTGTSGLYHGDFSPKPSCASLANLAHMLPGQTFQQQLPLTGDIQAYEFANAKEGRYMTIAWGRSGALPVAIYSPTNTPVARIDLFGNTANLPASDGLTMTSIDASPVYFVSQQPFTLSNLASAQALLSTDPDHARISVHVINPGHLPMPVTIGAGFVNAPPAVKQLTLAPGQQRDVTMTPKRGITKICG